MRSSLTTPAAMQPAHEPVAGRRRRHLRRGHQPGHAGEHEGGDPLGAGCAARLTATRPPKEWPSTTTRSAQASRAGATSSAYPAAPAASAGTGEAPPKPGRSRARASSPSSTSRKSLRDRIQPGQGQHRAGGRAVLLAEQAVAEGAQHR